MAQQPIIELFDWLANPKCIRGSRLFDNGLWVSTSNPPNTFDPLNRIVTLTDGTRFLLKKDTAAKVLQLHKVAEQFLSTLPPTTV